MFEVQKNIDEAWQHRTEAPKYVVARILWFKLTLSFLNNNSIENNFGQLKAVLKNEDAFMDWTMQPVLDHIKPKLTEQQYALLSALIDAMSDKQNIKKLNDFAAWRDAIPEEIV